MEIEARYAVPDRRTFDALRDLREIGHFTFHQQDQVRIVDHYLDTDDRALTNQRWACRLRSEDGRWYVTLKGPRRDEGSITSRLEWEFPLERPSPDPADWPNDEVRRLVPHLANNAPLSELAVVEQTRHRYHVVADSRLIVEASLDRVTIDLRTAHHRSYVLECELAEQGQRPDLERLDALLTDMFDLKPERLSKLQKALWLAKLADPHRIETEERLTPDMLADRYHVARAHTDHMTHMVEVLYNGLQRAHGLAPWHRSLARTAAQLCAVGELVDHGNRERASRDVILAHRLEGLDDVDRRVVAAAAFLHRGPITSKRIKRAFPEPIDRPHTKNALAIAALVRMVSALNCSQVDRTAIERIEPAEDDAPARIVLSGPRADKDAKRASRRSDLWAQTVGRKPVWEALTVPPERRLGLETGDSMQDAAVKILSHHFDAMLAHEPGTREGLDPEELHDMRVATRRMRAALRLFGGYLASALVPAANEGLRTTARVLGQVRDLDVDLEAAQAFFARQPEDDNPHLSPLLKEWTHLRDVRRGQMLAYLDGEAYHEFHQTFRRMLADQDDSRARLVASPPARSTGVRYITLYWQGILAYSEVLEGAPMEILHQLRIDCKRLRYTLEFFQELLAPDATRLVKEANRMQDHLGILNDARTSLQRVEVFLRQGTGDSTDLTGAKAYRDYRRLQIRQAVSTLPEMWKSFTRKSVRRRFRALAKSV